jgi:hypothetical protein
MTTFVYYDNPIQHLLDTDEARVELRQNITAFINKIINLTPNSSYNLATLLPNIDNMVQNATDNEVNNCLLMGLYTYEEFIKYYKNYLTLLSRNQLSAIHIHNSVINRTPWFISRDNTNIIEHVVAVFDEGIKLYPDNYSELLINIVNEIGIDVFDKNIVSCLYSLLFEYCMTTTGCDISWMSELFIKDGNQYVVGFTDKVRSDVMRYTLVNEFAKGLYSVHMNHGTLC